MRYNKSFCRVYLKAHASAVMARSSCSRAANICTKSTCPLYPCQTENQNCNMQTQMHSCDLNSVSHLEIGTCDCKPPPCPPTLSSMLFQVYAKLVQKLGWKKPWLGDTFAPVVYCHLAFAHIYSSFPEGAESASNYRFNNSAKTKGQELYVGFWMY